MEKLHEFLKTNKRETFRMEDTDQHKGVPSPPLQKEYPPNVKLIDLVAPENFKIGQISLIEVIRNRKSHRKFTDQPLTLEELSFLLWATQGVHEIWRNGGATRRTVPSGGSRHSFETYLVINRVENIAPGLYRYLALEHKLYQIPSEGNLAEQIGIACKNQKFVGKSAVVFIWTVIPYRKEWRYGKISHKSIAIDAGHLCQNLYLAAGAIKAGTCAIGAYTQKDLDAFLKVDGKDEFAIYVAPVGKIE